MLRLGTATLLSVLLLGCAVAPQTSVDATTTTPDEQPDLSLNLPDNSVAPCPDDSAPASLLDRGFSALIEGRHVEAISLFKRHKKSDDSRVAAWEAGIAIAYDSMLSQSPFFDPADARAAFARLGAVPPVGRPAHENSLMMRDALATFSALLDRIAQLRGDKAALVDDLAKREEAIKRLRELTLGQ
ncbi:MAG: hypothetical protein HKN19_10455 [Halioglobus sp.]|nr:hypothetical protein [Halioglobus sp.]